MAATLLLAAPAVGLAAADGRRDEDAARLKRPQADGAERSTGPSQNSIPHLAEIARSSAGPGGSRSGGVSGSGTRTHAGSPQGPSARSVSVSGMRRGPGRAPEQVRGL